MAPEQSKKQKYSHQKNSLDQTALSECFDLLSTMVLVVSVDAKIHYANIAFKNTSGFSPQSLNALLLTDILQAPFLSKTFKLLADEIATPVRLEAQLKNIFNQGDTPVLVTFSPFQQKGLMMVEMQLIDAHIKQQKEAYFQEVSKANKEMIRNLAHEIKNPLGGVKGAAQLLEMELENPELIDYTQVIIREADRLQNLVDRLLEPHKKAQERVSVNIHEISEHVATLILAEFPQGLAIVRDYDASIPEFLADRSQLVQVLLNIMKNAAQALKCKIAAGEASICLRTRVITSINYLHHPSKMMLELTITDNGPGIPEDLQERIFFPLVSGKDGGAGLGLTLAQIFIHQHEGTIDCASQPNHTEFKILLPLAR